MANPIILDISHHNPEPIDWAMLKKQGTVGIIHKATEGKTYVDNKLFSHAKEAIAAGMHWSTYHFLKAGDPEGQMQFYLDTIDPRQGERVCIDHEEKATLDELKRAVKYIRDKRPDLQVAIYSGHLIKDQLGSKRDDYLAANARLWLAQYTNGTPSWPTATWPQWDLWQHSETTFVDGFGEKGANCDANKWNGPVESLGAWFGAAPVPAPAPAPEPAPIPVEDKAVITITIPPGLAATVVINGKVIEISE